MINAREAKRRSVKKVQEQIDFYLEDLNTRIIVAADRGDQHIYANFLGIGHHVIRLIKNHLVAKGYRVIDCNVSYQFKISWESPAPGDE